MKEQAYHLGRRGLVSETSARKTEFACLWSLLEVQLLTSVRRLIFDRHAYADRQMKPLERELKMVSNKEACARKRLELNFSVALGASIDA